MDLGLKGKTAIVTGAGSQIGYGKGIALTLAHEGCDIVVSDKDIEGAEQTAAKIKALGGEANAIKADISDCSEVKKMVKAALSRYGKIDILVNNAGYSSPMKPFVDKPESEWSADININLKGTAYCSQAVLGHMISRKKGKIINISSSGARTGGAGVAAYCAAKAGIIAFTKSLAAEVAALGINVNAIAPGPGDTGFVRQAPPDMLEMVLKKIPLGRTTTPQDIGNMVAILASDVSIDVVGQTIIVDGGMIMY